MAGKILQFLKLRDDKLYAIADGFDKYVSINTNSALLSLDYKNINKNIFCN